MVMIEAMACGTPVVALRAGSVPEVVVDGVTGIICDIAGSARRRAAPTCRRIDPIDCRAHVASHFCAAALARGYAEAYRRAIALMPRVLTSAARRRGPAPNTTSGTVASRP